MILKPESVTSMRITECKILVSQWILKNLGFTLREALINSSVNYQSTKKVKCDFTFFFILNGLSTIENGSTSLCCGNSALIRVSLG